MDLEMIMFSKSLHHCWGLLVKLDKMMRIGGPDQFTFITTVPRRDGAPDGKEFQIESTAELCRPLQPGRGFVHVLVILVRTK